VSTNFSKIIDIKFREYSFYVSDVVTCRQTNMEKLIGEFIQFSIAGGPKMK
jgi:hypothetical protein